MKEQIAIISRVLDLLSTYDARQLESAAASGLVAGDVREAISALARARANKGDATVGRKNGSPKAPGSTTRRDEGVSKRIERDIRAALLDQSVVGSAHDLAELLAKTEVGAPYRSKDGRGRLVDRFFRAIEPLSPTERSEKLQILLRNLKPNDTEGWFRVIRGAAE